MATIDTKRKLRVWRRTETKQRQSKIKLNFKCSYLLREEEPEALLHLLYLLRRSAVTRWRIFRLKAGTVRFDKYNSVRSLHFRMHLRIGVFSTYRDLASGRSFRRCNGTPTLEVVDLVVLVSLEKLKAPLRRVECTGFQASAL